MIFRIPIEQRVRDMSRDLRNPIRTRLDLNRISSAGIASDYLRI